ncbi:MAG: hypothetical protein E7455_04550 [Ruminococcaceae bacterium]|nr:hypothetical protein [Oscillospiraceae bacterium]
MIRFGTLNKNEKERWLPQLFDLFYDNMRKIAPSELSYEQEKQQWLGAVSPALEKAPRQIILCFADDSLAGYVQYYTNGNLLMIEEVQIKQAYQRTTLFYCFGKYLAKMLPADLETLEAFAVKQNLRSRKLMGKLGMTQIDENSNFVHLRGSAREIRQIFE